MAPFLDDCSSSAYQWKMSGGDLGRPRLRSAKSTDSNRTAKFCILRAQSMEQSATAVTCSRGNWREATEQ